MHFIPIQQVGLFQSTLSVRRATSMSLWLAHATQISIHALREESDVVDVGVGAGLGISIHALREESDHRHKSSP